MATVVIYTKSYCGFCDQAKRLLNRIGATYQEIDVTHDFPLWQAMVEQSGQFTVPQILIDGHAIGGYSELATLARDGKLLGMLDLNSSDH